MLRSTAAVGAVLTAVSLVSGCGGSSNKGKPQSTAWGHHTWRSGVTIEVVGARPCKPSSTAYPGDARFGAIVSIRVRNGGVGDYRLRDMAPSNPERAEGASRLLADPGGPCEAPLLPDKQVAPGHEVTFDSAYTVNDSSGKMTLVLSPDHDAEPIAYTGRVHITRGA